MILSETDYRSKVMGCWTGKNIGGTLGAPFEWRRQRNSVSFYTQALAGEPMPNDDLDIQLLWLIALEEKGVELDAHTLAEYWTLYVTPHWSEYGTAKVNMRAGLVPPLCGTRGNDFKHSCGAFIRSEIWACIAPGDPHLAARFALEDAMLDHGDGEGTFAEVFMAALESAAFVEKNIDDLIQIGLSFLPSDCGVAGAVRCALSSYVAKLSCMEARDEMLRHYRGGTFFGWRHYTSAEDWEKGFGDGIRGWDAPCNIGITVLALLYGGGDFSKTICTAVNCGEDTDCTAASVGALFGILHGIEAIPEKWITPIGRKIKTACLNLGELGFYGDQLPADVEALTDRTLAVARQVTLRHRPMTRLAAQESNDLSDYSSTRFRGGEDAKWLYERLRGPVFRFDFFEVYVDYAGDASVSPGRPKDLEVRFRNLYKIQASLNLQWYAAEGWQILPSKNATVLSLPPSLGEHGEMKFRIVADKVDRPLTRLVLEISSDGRPAVMLVPVAFQNGSNLA